MAVREWWEDHFKILEFLLAVFVGVVCGVWIYCFDGWGVVDSFLAGKREAIHGTLAALLGSLLGFVIAAVAIVIGETSRLGFIKKAGQLSNLFDVFRMSITALGIGTVLSLVALVADGDKQPQRWVPPLVLFATTLATLRVARAIWILGVVMRKAAQE